MSTGQQSNLSLVGVVAPFADHSFETPYGQVRVKAGFRDAILQALNVVCYVSGRRCFRVTVAPHHVISPESTRAISAAVSPSVARRWSAHE